MRYQFVELFGRCSCSGLNICSFCGRLTLAVLGILFGALIALNPKKTIEIQTAIYRPFNWKLEPISMKKELRNMRIMGLALILCGAASIVLLLVIK